MLNPTIVQVENKIVVLDNVTVNIEKVDGLQLIKVQGEVSDEKMEEVRKLLLDLAD